MTDTVVLAAITTWTRINIFSSKPADQLPATVLQVDVVPECWARCLFLILCHKCLTHRVVTGDLREHSSILFTRMAALPYLCNHRTQLRLSPYLRCHRHHQVVWMFINQYNINATSLIIALVCFSISRFWLICLKFKYRAETLLVWRLVETIWRQQLYMRIELQHKLQLLKQQGLMSLVSLSWLLTPSAWLVMAPAPAWFQPAIDHALEWINSRLDWIVHVVLNLLMSSLIRRH